MADSLFDNRYRYDYIYPRGRSGETLRAIDVEANERLVVVKRPAPNDAPPIRAGQEVSILNERKALKRLSGHPVLTEVLGEGQFFVGGQPHQYIVVERATGMIVADNVLTLARSGERWPHLEMLVIVDQLLDLLEAAHEKDVIYNDVDAKHLFWSRESYRLKVIDWGNAVFLEGDTVTPQGVGRQTDVYQAGELLYFMLTGGSRADVVRDAGAEFRADFGEDTERVPRPLQIIVSKALHPSSKFRYPTISALRKDLTDYRRPFERERDSMVNHIFDRLRRDLSKNELKSLANTLDPAAKIDPAHPEVRRARAELEDRLRDIEVSADLDAVRIYMTGGNWAKAADLLHELRDKAGSSTTGLVELLLDCTLLLLEAELPIVPVPITDAVGMIFDGHMVRAANTLLTQDTADDRARKYQWLMTERISSRVPEILLLRPNLYRLDLALSELAADNVNIQDARAHLQEINRLLDNIPAQASTNLSELRDGYRGVVDKLGTLNKLLSTLMVQERLSNRRLPLNALDRATNAAMALADNMHVIGKQAAGSPRDALVALDNSRAIDPTNALWDELARLLNTLYESLQRYQTYVPAADGSDLADWLKTSRQTLEPYTVRLFDEMLVNMVNGLQTAESAWATYSDCVLVGDRGGALDAIDAAVKALTLVSPTLAGWLSQLRSIINGAAYVQRHALFGGLGRALADGYEAFDRGRLGEAETLGNRAVEIATSEAQRDAARRLLDMAEIAREWVERGGIQDGYRTQAALNRTEALYTDDELRERERFAAQMPTADTYLRAMQKGLVEVYQRRSTPAVRLFYMNAILLGALEAHEKSLEDAHFWREVAVRVLGDYAIRHPLTQVLDEFLERRRLLGEVSAALNSLHDKEALQEINAIRRKLSDSAELKVLADAGQSLRDFETALRSWAEGDFKNAGMKLESALNLAANAEKSADIVLDEYKAWLRRLNEVAAELHNLNRQMRQTIDRRPVEPVSIMQEAHLRQAQSTFVHLGEPYHAQLQNWHETYEKFLAIYTDSTIRRSVKLERFNELFKALFIDRHPAYSLYRHWYDVTESSSEFPAPPTQEPTPREADEPADAVYLGTRYEDDHDDRRPAPIPVRSMFSPRLLILLVILVVAGALGAVFVMGNLNNGEAEPTPTVAEVASSIPTTQVAQVNVPIIITDPNTELDVTVTPEFTDEPTSDSGDIAPMADTGEATPTLIVRVSDTPTATIRPTNTQIPSNTPIPSVTPSPTPSATDTPTKSPTPSITPTPTLPPQGIQGTQELLTLLERFTDDQRTWNTETFTPARGSAGWQIGIPSEPSTEADSIVVSIDADTLDFYYGNNAPSRIREMEANLSFTTYNPSVVDIENVYFGAALRSVNDPAIVVGIRVGVVNLNAVNLYLFDGETETFIVQRSVNTIDPRLRFERDANTGNVTIYYDDEAVGEPMPFLAPEAPVTPELFTTNGGVMVNVTSWRLRLR